LSVGQTPEAAGSTFGRACPAVLVHQRHAGVEQTGRSRREGGSSIVVSRQIWVFGGLNARKRPQAWDQLSAPIQPAGRCSLARQGRGGRSSDGEISSLLAPAGGGGARLALSVWLRDPSRMRRVMGRLIWGFRPDVWWISGGILVKTGPTGLIAHTASAIVARLYGFMFGKSSGALQWGKR